jgi:Flp pilus assembly protein TadD
VVSPAITLQSYTAYQQAVSFERGGQLKEAETAIRKAIALDPDDPYNMTKLAGILTAQGKNPRGYWHLQTCHTA